MELEELPNEIPIANLSAVSAATPFESPIFRCREGLTEMNEDGK
jgi:hypothetical protein